MTTLNARQEAFALAYALNGNATDAALRAGYSPQTAYSQGHRLLKNAEIVREIDQRRSEMSEQAIVSVQWVLARLVSVYEKAFHGAPKILGNGAQAFDAEGNAIMEWSPSGANKALELIGRHLGMFVERAEVQVTVTRDVVELEIEKLEKQLAVNDRVRA